VPITIDGEPHLVPRRLVRAYTPASYALGNNRADVHARPLIVVTMMVAFNALAMSPRIRRAGFLAERIGRPSQS
jgi:hypothetical protein